MAAPDELVNCIAISFFTACTCAAITAELMAPFLHSFKLLNPLTYHWFAGYNLMIVLIFNIQQYILS